MFRALAQTDECNNGKSKVRGQFRPKDACIKLEFRYPEV